MDKFKLLQPTKSYFIASPSHWPILGSISLFLLLVGAINILHDNWYGPYLVLVGFLLFGYMLYGWFSTVIDESIRGLHSQQMDRTYRWGMAWFIASEVSFFGIFFFALFYARFIAVPTLGSGDTQFLLWPKFIATWPLFKNPNPELFVGPKEVIKAWGIPVVNTLLLLSSAATVTWAHWSLKKNERRKLNLGLILTILLGVIFLGLQAYEYAESYTHFNLTLASGIYGTTFFMLTGFHALHVTLGLCMLTIILIRCFKGHFLPEHHFAFEAVSWYWHFVDFVWLFLFVFVYWL